MGAGHLLQGLIPPPPVICTASVRSLDLRILMLSLPLTHTEFTTDPTHAGQCHSSPMSHTAPVLLKTLTWNFTAWFLSPFPSWCHTVGIIRGPCHGRVWCPLCQRGDKTCALPASVDALPQISLCDLPRLEFTPSALKENCGPFMCPLHPSLLLGNLTS